MTGFDQLVGGFAVALSWKGLLYCFIGCLWGTIVGVLPGLGPLAGMTLLLPLTFGLDPAIGIIMLTGIFYGAMYGGSTTSILVRIPGEAASVVTCIDGYEMARQGRAGPALMIAAVGSFIGGTVSILGLMFIAPPLAKVMVAIGPSVEVVLMLLALGVITIVSAGSRLKTALMVVLGLAARLGRARQSHRRRRASPSAIRASPAACRSPRSRSACSAFRKSSSTWRKSDDHQGDPSQARATSCRAWKDLRDAAPAIGRGSVIGFIFGIIPGVSHVVSTFVSYAMEKRFSKHPEEFGKGAIAGVAGPETANNAVTGTAMIPLLALGIPSIPATAILLSALTIHGVQPGPLLLTDHPEVFWSLVASMYIGNVMLLILNLPLVGIFVNLLRIPYVWLVPIILIISIIGVYSVNFSAPTSGSWCCRARPATCCASSATRWRRCCWRWCSATGWKRVSGSALTMSGGNYATFADQASVIVLRAALGFLLARAGVGLGVRLPQDHGR